MVVEAEKQSNEGTILCTGKPMVLPADEENQADEEQQGET